MPTAKTKAIYATGRRKEASARVYLQPLEAGEEENEILVNKRPLREYFPLATTQQIVLQPLVLTERSGKYSIKVRVSGGGSSGQAGAVRHGISRVLEKVEPELRGTLKTAGFLTRDPRAVERKKPGRHKARKKPQFSKR
jgi:small subunit ribosomal protein S9